MAKVQISMDNELLAKIDKFASSNYMSRSGFISLATSQYLQSAETFKAIKDLSACMRRIADNGNIDEQSKKELEEFETFARLFAENE